MQNDVDETDLGYLEYFLEHGLRQFDCTLVKFNITSVSGVDKKSIPELKKHFTYCDLSSYILADNLGDLIWIEYEMWSLDRGDFDYFNPEALTYRKEEILIDYLSLQENESNQDTEPDAHHLAFNDISEHTTSLIKASLSDCELDCYLSAIEELILGVIDDYADEDQPLVVMGAVKDLYDKMLAEYWDEDEKQQELDSLMHAEWSSNCSDLTFGIENGCPQNYGENISLLFVSKFATHRLRIEIEQASSDTQKALAKFTVFRQPQPSGCSPHSWREIFSKEDSVALARKPSEKSTVKAINKLLNSKTFWN